MRRSSVLIAATVLLPTLLSFGISPTTTATPSEAPSSQQLTWGLRASFRNYLSIPATVSDGATQHIPEGTTTPSHFTFPLREAHYTPDNHTTTATFGGSVNYKAYCSADKARCELDLTLSNPTIILSDTDSYLTATYSSTQYGTGTTVSKDNARIATINTSTASFSQANDITTWENLTTTLDAEGTALFSDFYPAGEALDPLAFSYQGPGAPTQGTGDTRLATSHITSIEANGGRVLPLGDHAVVASGRQWEALNTTTAASAGKVDLSTPNNATVIATNSVDTVLWADGHSLLASSLVDGVLTPPRTVATAPRRDKGLFDPEDAFTGVTIVPGGTAEEWTGYALWSHADGTGQLFTITAAGGEITASSVPIASVATTVPVLAGTPAGNLAEVFGPTYSFGDVSSMGVLPDGTLLLPLSGSITLDDDTSMRLPLLRLDPAARNAEGEVEVTILEGTEGVRQALTYATAFRVRGENIAAYNTRAGESSRIQFFRYTQGVVQPVGEYSQLGTIDEISGVDFDPKGDALVSSASSGLVQWVDPGTRTVSRTAAMPHTVGTERLHALSAASGTEVLALGIVEVEWEDRLEFNRLVVAEETETPDAPEVPETEETDPETPSNPATTEAPDANTPEITDPETPEVPETEETTPETPSNPATPEAPDANTPVVTDPEAPEMPETEESNPETPSNPATPETPEVPEAEETNPATLDAPEPEAPSPGFPLFSFLFFPALLAVLWVLGIIRF